MAGAKVAEDDSRPRRAPGTTGRTQQSSRRGSVSSGFQQSDSPQLTSARLPLAADCKDTGVGAEGRETTAQLLGSSVDVMRGGQSLGLVEGCAHGIPGQRGVVWERAEDGSLLGAWATGRTEGLAPEAGKVVGWQVFGVGDGEGQAAEVPTGPLRRREVRAPPDTWPEG